MALSFSEVVAKAKEIETSGGQAVVNVAISTLQTDGICMWAQGQLQYEAGGINGPVLSRPSLRSDGFSLTCYFSSRRGSNHAPVPGTIQGDEQPFFAQKTSKLRLTVTPFSFGQFSQPGQLGQLLHNGPSASLRFEDQSTKSFSISLAATGDLLTGIGPAIANDTNVDHAVYTFGFSVFKSNPPH